jgi:hypothetical protein
VSDSLPYVWTAPRLSADFDMPLGLVREQSRRLIDAGYLRPLRVQQDRESAIEARQQWRSFWWPYDASDYALEAPELLPAGSCLDVGGCGAEQRIVRRAA